MYNHPRSALYGLLSCPGVSRYQTLEAAAATHGINPADYHPSPETFRALCEAELSRAERAVYSLLGFAEVSPEMSLARIASIYGVSLKNFRPARAMTTCLGYRDSDLSARTAYQAIEALGLAERTGFGLMLTEAGQYYGVNRTRDWRGPTYPLFYVDRFLELLERIEAWVRSPPPEVVAALEKRTRASLSRRQRRLLDATGSTAEQRRQGRREARRALQRLKLARMAQEGKRWREAHHRLHLSRHFSKEELAALKRDYYAGEL